MLLSKQLLLNYVLKRRPKNLQLKPLKNVLQDFIYKFLENFRRHFREDQQKTFVTFSRLAISVTKCHKCYIVSQRAILQLCSGISGSATDKKSLKQSLNIPCQPMETTHFTLLAFLLHFPSQSLIRRKQSNTFYCEASLNINHK